MKSQEAFFDSEIENRNRRKVERERNEIILHLIDIFPCITTSDSFALAPHIHTRPIAIIMAVCVCSFANENKL